MPLLRKTQEKHLGDHPPTVPDLSHPPPKNQMETSHYLTCDIIYTIKLTAQHTAWLIPKNMWRLVHRNSLKIAMAIGMLTTLTITQTIQLMQNACT